jgi:hypothetical protein
MSAPITKYNTNDVWEIVNYWQSKGVIPATLAEIQDPISGYVIPVDPEEGANKVYKYSVTGDNKFELCATFSQKGNQSDAMSAPITKYNTNDVWAHEAGRVCFPRTIDADLYPVRVK